MPLNERDTAIRLNIVIKNMSVKKVFKILEDKGLCHDVRVSEYRFDDVVLSTEILSCRDLKRLAHDIESIPVETPLSLKEMEKLIETLLMKVN